MNNNKHIFIILLVFLLVACGGGGGGSGSAQAVVGGDDNSDASDGSSGGETETNVEKVIRSGNIFEVPGYDAQSDLVAEAIAEIEDITAFGSDFLTGIYGSAAIDYSVDKRTNYVQYPAYERKRNGIVPLLKTGSSRVHAVAGVYKGEFGRFSFFGTAPPVLFENGQNLAYEPAFERLLAWLLGDAPGSTSALAGSPVVVLARTHNNTELTTWFEKTLPNATVSTCGNSEALSVCANGATIIVLGKNGSEALLDADVLEIDRLLRASTPVLYLHGALEHDTAGSTAYSALIGANFPYAGNFFRSEAERNTSWNNVEAMLESINADNKAIATALDHIDKASFQFDWNSALSDGTVDTAAVVGYQERFGDGAAAVRGIFTTLDDQQIAIFDEPIEDFRLSRILALIGDELRQNVVFPMDIINSDQNAFLASYFADHLVYNTREINPHQADRGFHGSRSQSEVTPADYQAVINTRFTGRKPTGAYALPGRPFTVTRTDANSDVNVEIYWNLQFSNGVFEFRTGDRYDMPKFLRSQEINLEPGESITVSTPYGGVIQVRHGKGDSEAKNIELSFQGVGQHPFYDGPASANAFEAGLAAQVYDWAEIATAETYVTEPLDLMINTMEAMKSALDWEIEEVARVGTRYYYNEMFRLSGYRGFDIPAQPAEVTAFCTANGWECANDDYHGVAGAVEGNIRQSITNCGSFGGCSNQPVTYTWNWNPLGAGPVHERGHHLEGNSGAGYHTFAPLHAHHLTNIWRAYLPYAHYLETGNIGACGVERSEHRSNGTRFQILQDAQNSADVYQHMADNIWNSSQLGAMTRAMITQFAAHAKDQGDLEDGWNYFPLMLIAARELKQKLDEGEAAFDAAKARYGLDEYSHAEAADMVSTEDGQRSWALITYSLITNRDQRDYFTMLGFDFTDKANTQMNSLFPFSLFSSPAAKQFYAFDDICSVGEAIAVPVDGTSAWPEDRPTVFE